jgi:hypothetical protein
MTYTLVGFHTRPAGPSWSDRQQRCPFITLWDDMALFQSLGRYPVQRQAWRKLRKLIRYSENCVCLRRSFIQSRQLCNVVSRGWLGVLNCTVNGGVRILTGGSLPLDGLDEEVRRLCYASRVSGLTSWL